MRSAASLAAGGLARLREVAGVSASTWPPARVFAVTFALLALGWGFWWALYFPGCASTDSNDILKMVLGIDATSNHFRYEGLSSHHPLLYTGFVAAVVLPVRALTGSVTAAVGAFSLVQMLLLAACVAAAVAWLARRGAPRVLVVVVVLFFVANPLVGRYAVTLWKDIPFAGALLLFSLACCDVARTRGAWLSSRRRWAALIVLACLVALLRSNGALVVLACAVVLALACRPRGVRIAARVAVAVVAVLVVQGVGAKAAGVESAHFAETVSLPLQQLARTSVEGGNLSEEQQEVLYSLLPRERIAELFNPVTPNPLKFAPDFNDDYLDAHKAEFIGAWLGALPANLETYVQAWADETRGYWDVAQDSWLVVEPGYDIADADANVAASLLPGLLEDGFFAGEHPTDVMARVAWPLCNCACLGLFVLTFLIGAWAARRPGLAGMALPGVFLWATMLMAAPISNEFRYLFALHMLLPFLVCGLWRNVSGGGGKGERGIDDGHRLGVSRPDDSVGEWDAGDESCTAGAGRDACESPAAGPA